jgi:hypothetical protein
MSKQAQIILVSMCGLLLILVTAITVLVDCEVLL